jgi:hypothetical protein
MLNSAIDEFLSQQNYEATKIKYVFTYKANLVSTIT